MLSSREAALSLLEECTQKKDLEAGRHAHLLIASSRLESVSILSDRLVRLFAVCGTLLEVNLAFCRAGNLTTHTWHGIISAHVFSGEHERALFMYWKMQQEGFAPDKFIFSIILKACASTLALLDGRKIHAQITKSGSDTSKVVQTALVDMYAKCGYLQEAKDVFSKFRNHDTVLWGAMFTGYAQHEDAFSAFELFQSMLDEDIRPDNIVLLCMLKACVCTEAIEHGSLMHYLIVSLELESDLLIGNTLIDMYAKCGSLEDATRVFGGLPLRDMVTWGAMVTGCAQHENGLGTLELLEQMLQEGMEPDKVIFSSALKVCSSMEAAFGQGNAIHAMLIEGGLEKELIVGNSLADLYAKSGHLDDALGVFEQLKSRNVVSWNVIIAGLVQDGQALLAIDLYAKMQREGYTADKNTLAYLLRACIGLEELQQGRLTHAKIIQSGFECDVALTNTLIDLYASCEKLSEAYTVFELVHNKDASTWNAMVAACLQQGHEQMAGELLDQMEHVGVNPSKLVFLSALKACITHEALHEGRLIHQLALMDGLEPDPAISASLVDMYAKCGSVHEALMVFKSLPNRNVVLWSSIIAGYDQHGHSSSALELYTEMLQGGITPDKITFVCVLKACANTGAVISGMLIHDQIARRGFLCDLVAGNALVDLYGKCGCLDQARKVFDGMPNRDVVSWGSMISGHVQHDCGHLALELFEKMQHADIKPDEIIFSSILKACNGLGSVWQGMIIHDWILRSGIPSKVVIGNTLVDMYAKYGYLNEANLEFNKILNRDVVSWNTIISGFSQHDQGFPALALFDNMQSCSVKPDSVTFTCTLKACGMTGTIKYGRLIHDKMIKSGVVADASIGNTLVDMYSNCGSLDEACNSFERLSCKNVVSWNAMIAGYVQLGDHRQADECFRNMQQEGLKPDSWTYTSMLTSCRSCGLVEEGQKYLLSMRDHHGLMPSIEHLNCMVELLGSTGRLHEAEKVLKSMPTLPDATGWMTLLTACRLHGSCDLGRMCFSKATRFDPYHGAGYVLMSNILVDASMWHDADRLQMLRKDVSAWKKPGIAWIELHSKMHEFIVADRAHCEHGFVESKLHGLKEDMGNKGYIPHFEGVLEGMACA